MSKLKYCLILLFLLPNICSFKPDDSKIVEQIRDIFTEWQAILKNDFDNADIIFYCTDDPFEEGKYYHNLNSDEQNSMMCISTYYLLREENLGTYLKIESSSPSSDYSIISDHYFNKEGKLYFIYWKMNTFHGMDCAVTVIRRVYFDSEGNQIKQSEKVYKMNTEIEIETSFYDPGVKYKTSLYEMDFYKYWDTNFGK